MTENILKTLPMRQGHFLLESGLHSDLWFDLNALFLSPHDLAPTVAALAELLRPHAITAICGPLRGGAFLAHALATHMNLRFYFSEKVIQKNENEKALFEAKYELPSALRNHVRHERVAIVDDVISAGSSVRATLGELTEAGATVVAVGTILLLGNQATNYFKDLNLALVSLAQRDFNFWTPAICPLCKAGIILESPAT